VIKIVNAQVEIPRFSIPDFKIENGTHLLIHGASGCGKTTLLHLIAGLLLPNEGHVEIDGKRLNHLTDSERCRFRHDKFGIIFQKLNLLDHLTALENVLLGVHRDDMEKARSALSLVNLSDRHGERCAHLSLGEQQRVAVARVLAQTPYIVLADEPTSSLDQKNCDFVMDALKKVSKDKTLIVVSHDGRISKYFDQTLRFEDMIR
jgi:putative ABC transport system ATP-binding protein